MNMTIKFQLGQIVATPAALAAIEKSGDNTVELIDRHMRLEQGELDGEDHRANQQAVKLGNRILSSFALKNGTKVWVITEADRSSTCVLLPEDY